MPTNYMNLTLPVVGPNGTQGPAWADEINAAITTIDSHDHSANNGKKITPAGININQALQMNYQALTQINALFMQNLTALATDPSVIYEYGGELYFNDSSGNQVQLTSGGTINVAALGTITGDYSTSTADLTYSDAAKAYIFKQSATLTANVSTGPLSIFRNVAASKYAKLQISASQAVDLDWTLPVAYPASTLPLKSSSTGVMSLAEILTADIGNLQVTEGKLAALAVTAAKLAANAVETAKILNGAVTDAKIQSGGLTAAGLATDSVTTIKIQDGAVTPAKKSALGEQVSASCGGYTTSSLTFVDVTNLSVTITSTGRPLFICLNPVGVPGDSSYIGMLDTADNAGYTTYLNFTRNGSNFGTQELAASKAAGTSMRIHTLGSIIVVDRPAAGTYTYKAQLCVSTSDVTASMYHYVLMAFEL